MGILLKFDLARERFEVALDLALSKEDLPPEWIERSKKVGQAASRTFTPMLGTALLAKATDDSVDALALKEGANHKSYSARTLATHVLVPLCVEAGVSLRTSGREPLNNQPFFRYERVSRDMKIKSGRGSDLDYLVDTLERVDFLRGDATLAALAAFLRVRLDDPDTRRKPLLITNLDLDDLRHRVREFVRRNSDGGKVGQALVAGALRLAFSEVQTSRVNDPSRTWAGDVLVRRKLAESPVPVLSVEVKQRPTSLSEVQQFVSRLGAHGIARGMIAAFSSTPIPQDEVNATIAKAWDSDSVLLSVFQDTGSFLDWALQSADIPLEEFVRLLPNEVAEVLQDLEAKKEILERWSAAFTSVVEDSQQPC